MQSELDTVAFLLEYPGVAFESKLETARVETAPTERMEQAYRALAEYLERVGRAKAEERYTGLFDLSPVCTLHVGYHLFGDAYGRGELLAGLVGELRGVGVPLGDDIPDFLPLLLRLVGRVQSDENRAIFLEDVLLPGLEKMIEALGDTGDPWGELVRALPELLRELHGEIPTKEVAAHA